MLDLKAGVVLESHVGQVLYWFIACKMNGHYAFARELSVTYFLCLR